MLGHVASGLGLLVAVVRCGTGRGHQEEQQRAAAEGEVVEETCLHGEKRGREWVNEVMPLRDRKLHYTRFGSAVNKSLRAFPGRLSKPRKKTREAGLPGV